MFKELRFDAQVGCVRRNEKYDKEWDAIHQFYASEHENMMLEYDTIIDARNATNTMRRMTKRENIPVRIGLVRQRFVLVTRIGGGVSNV